MSSPAAGVAARACLFFHGLGDTGAGWSFLEAALGLPGLKWTFPTAPIIPVTINGGSRGRAWFDMVRGCSAGMRF
jgi:predicted esterase